MDKKTRSQFMADKMYYGAEDMVDVNALDFISLLVKEESQERTIKVLQNKLEALQTALECLRNTKHTVDLRA
jgi:uncharacterized protein (DUF1778 family)